MQGVLPLAGHIPSKAFPFLWGSHTDCATSRDGAHTIEGSFFWDVTRFAALQSKVVVVVGALTQTAPLHVAGHTQSKE